MGQDWRGARYDTRQRNDTDLINEELEERALRTYTSNRENTCTSHRMSQGRKTQAASNHCNLGGGLTHTKYKYPSAQTKYATD